MKPEPRGARRKPTKIECLAYHEAGHFVAAMFSRKRPAVRRLSVLPRDKTLGHVLHFSTPGFRSKADIELQPLSAINTIFDRLEHGKVAGRVVLDFVGAEGREQTPTTRSSRKLETATAG